MENLDSTGGLLGGLSVSETLGNSGKKDFTTTPD